MAVYLSMTVITCFFAFMASKNANSRFTVAKFKISKAVVYLTLAAIPMILVSGLRWKTGVDHTNYYYVFYNIRDNLATHVEIGFKMLCKLILMFTQNLSVLFFICTLITVGLTMIAIKKNSMNLFISVFLYISMGYFYYSMNSIRHFMALSIYLFAFYFMKKRKLIPYVICIIFAALFHKVALIALPIYFVLNIKFKAYWYGIFAAALFGMNLFHRQLLDFIYRFVFDFYKSYEAENTGYSVLNIGITLALAILAFMYHKKLLEKDKSNIIFINSAYFGLMFFALCGWVPVYTRIGQYLTILSLFFIPAIIDCEERAKIKKLYTISLLVGFFAFMIVILLNARDPRIALLPYHSILLK